MQPPPYPPKEGNYVECNFVNSMSGTFARETPGEWRTYDQLRSEVEVIEENSKRRSSTAIGLHLANRPTGSWYDIHAVRQVI